MESISSIFKFGKHRVKVESDFVIPDITRRLTESQKQSARVWHESNGTKGTELLYALYLSQTEKLVKAQREIEELRSGLDGEAHE